MFRQDVEGWLGIVGNISQESGWDRSLILTMQTDDRTFVAQVRKSSLVFIAQEQGRNSGAYSVAYTLFPSSPDETARRITAGEFRPAAFVDEQLEQWLLEHVARYVAESKLPD